MEVQQILHKSSIYLFLNLLKNKGSLNNISDVIEQDLQFSDFCVGSFNFAHNKK